MYISNSQQVFVLWQVQQNLLTEGIRKNTILFSHYSVVLIQIQYIDLLSKGLAFLASWTEKKM